MIYLFLDTNIFIHFIDFEQIDWQAILKTKDHLTITLAPVVIDELDKHKYNKNPKISKRVKKLLPKLEEYIDGSLSCKYPVHYITNRPSDEIFEINNLDRKEQDDNLLASILQFSKSKSDRVIYVTNDTAPRIRAKSLNIETYKLPEDFLLPNEPDEIERKNIALQKEMDDLRIKIPIINFTFFNNTNLIGIKRKKMEFTKEQFVTDELRKAKGLHPHLIYYPPREKTSAITFGTRLNSLSEHQVKDYNRQLDEYFKEFPTYAEIRYTLLQFNDNTVKLDFIITNTGTVPAEDIDIQLHFPEGFVIVTEDALLKMINPPMPPHRPRSREEGMYRMPRLNITAALQRQGASIKVHDPASPVIKKENGHKVTYKIKCLKHNQDFKLESLYALFDDIHVAKGFSISYKLHISNVPKEISGHLNLYFE